MATSSNPRPRLSVALIARDEQDVIAATLESVKSIANEIILVDTGSTDQTRDIAARFGARVLSRAWDDDFSAARNLALAHASGEWILLLDAGEMLAAGAGDDLRRFVGSQSDPGKAYLLAIETAPEAGNIFGEQAYQVRLIPNHRGLRFTGRVREHLRPSMEAAGLGLECLPWKVLRTARDHDPQVRLRRARRNLKLAELEIKQHGCQARLLCLQGEAMGQIGETSAAADCYRQALQLCQRGSTEMLEAYYGLLTTFDGDLANRPQQLSVCLEALEIYPFDAQLHCAMGSYLQAQGRIDLAARSYQMAVENGRIDLQTWHLTGIAEVATVCWSLSLQLLERDSEAGRVLEEALVRDVNSVRLRRHLINLYVKQDRRQDALAQVNLLPPDTLHREALRSAVRGACLAAKQNWIPALSYLRAAYTAGCRDGLCLRWLSIALLSVGETAAAEPVLHEWQSLEPKNPEVLKYLEVVAAGDPPSAVSRHLRVDAVHQPGTPALPSLNPMASFKPAGF